MKYQFLFMALLGTLITSASIMMYCNLWIDVLTTCLCNLAGTILIVIPAIKADLYSKYINR